MPLLDFKMLNPVEFEMENEALINFFTSTADTRELFWQQQDESDKHKRFVGTWINSILPIGFLC